MEYPHCSQSSLHFRSHSRVEQTGQYNIGSSSCFRATGCSESFTIELIIALRVLCNRARYAPPIPYNKINMRFRFAVFLLALVAIAWPQRGPTSRPIRMPSRGTRGAVAAGTEYATE